MANNAAPIAAAVSPPNPARTYRKSESHFVFPIWYIIRKLQQADRTTDLDTITEHLHRLHNQYRHLDRGDVINALRKMSADGLLIEDRESDTSTTVYTLPVDNDADDDDDGNTTDTDKEDEKNAGADVKLLSTSRLSRTRDCYCYECHRAGDVLACVECPRVFHAGCVRPGARLDVPLLRLREPVPDVIEKAFLLTFDFPYAKAKAWTGVHAAVGAAAAIAEDPQARRLCVRCRLLKQNAQHLRPLTSVEELHELLGYSFERVRSWIAGDTFSTQEPRSLFIPPVYVRLLQPVLMQRMRTIHDIAASIEALRYRSLVEYRADIMDVLHCVGVLRGTACAEYEAVKYMQLDALLDITEMARCQDCYRHSSDQADVQWFVRPCAVPHRLVFAKMPGFSHWPAKVIRQVRRPDGTAPAGVAGATFDVRFFGKDHTRALIVERYVVPDGRPIALKRTAGLKKALTELAEHKELLERQLTAGGRGGGSGGGSGGDDGDGGGKSATDDEMLVEEAPAAAATVEEASGAPRAKRGRTKVRMPESTAAAAATTTTKTKPTDNNSVSNVRSASTSSNSSGSTSSSAKTRSTVKTANRRRMTPNGRRATLSAAAAAAAVNESDGDTPPAKRLRRSRTIGGSASSIANGGNAAVAAAAPSAPAEQLGEQLGDANLNVVPVAMDETVDVVPFGLGECSEDVAEKSVDVLVGGVFDFEVIVEDEGDENVDLVEVQIDDAATATEVVEDEEDIDNDDDADWPLPESSSCTASNQVQLQFNNDAIADRSPPHLDAQEPNNDAIHIIARLRRKMVNCPPHFVHEAVAALREQLERNEQLVARHADHIVAVKRMHWCNLCLKQAIYYCCWRVSYCSPECQHADWKQQHEHTCKRVISASMSSQEEEEEASM